MIDLHLGIHIETIQLPWEDFTELVCLNCGAFLELPIAGVHADVVKVRLEDASLVKPHNRWKCT
jgi:hypothetical protein